MKSLKLKYKKCKLWLSLNVIARSAETNATFIPIKNKRYKKFKIKIKVVE